MSFTPHDAAVHAIERALDLLDTSRDQTLSSTVRGDLRRLSLVMAVAALDTYMHRLVVDRAYVHSALPGGLASLEIPFELLLAQADETGRAARAKPHRSRPRVAVKRELRFRLARETFQRYDDVSRALGMAGRSGNWNEIGARMNPTISPKQIRSRLDQIVGRRNQIVHEGDYVRLERPQGAKRNGMNLTQALTDISFIADLIDAIHGVV